MLILILAFPGSTSKYFSVLLVRVGAIKKKHPHLVPEVQADSTIFRAILPLHCTLRHKRSVWTYMFLTLSLSEPTGCAAIFLKSFLICVGAWDSLLTCCSLLRIRNRPTTRLPAESVTVLKSPMGQSMTCWSIGLYTIDWWL